MSRVLNAATVVLSGCGLAFAVAGAEAPAIRQPIQFDHLRHAKADIQCVQCHEGVEKSPRAGIPEVSVCMGCHGEDQASTPDMEKVLYYGKPGLEIPWVRLYRLPAHVVFSHERHVSFGGLACDACHGGHGKSEQPPRGPVNKVLTMNGCLECHRARGASTDCVACHK